MYSLPPAEQKALLRAAIGERLQHLSEKDREAESRSIVRRLEEIILRDVIVCGFMPLATEADIRPFLVEVRQRGQRLFLPTFDGHTIALREAHDLTTLRVSSFSIPEPPPSAPLLDPKVPAVILVPGRAFDLRGGRLGRGNGAYDRWVADHRKTSSASKHYGIALACQIVNEVPMAEHDQFLDGIVTARGLVETRK